MQPLFENDILGFGIPLHNDNDGGDVCCDERRGERVTLFDLFAHLGFALTKSSEYNK